MEDEEPGKSATIIHYFFQYPSLTANDVFRGLLKQVLKIFMNTGMRCHQQIAASLELCFGASNRIPDWQDVVSLLLGPLMCGLSHVFVSIDGIEDCSYDEQDKVWAGLRSLMRIKAFKLLVTGTDTIAVQRCLGENAPIVHLRMDQGLNEAPIAAYINHKLRILQCDGELLEDDNLYQWAQQQLLAKSDGMYETLINQTCLC